MRDPLDDRQEDRLLRLEPLLGPTAADLAADADVREEFLRRVAARRGLTPESLRVRLALNRHIVPAGEGADSAPPSPSLRQGSLPQPGLLSCTGAVYTAADATVERDGAVSGASAEALAPVSPHAVPSGGAGTYDDGTAWGEAAPARRRLHPFAYLALLLAASWLALMVTAAVAAIEATNALRGK